MDETHVLQMLFQKSMDLNHESSGLKQEVLNLVLGKKISLNELVDDFNWQETRISPEKTIENWKKFLTLNLLNYYAKSHTNQLAALLHIFEQQSWNQSSQYFRLIAALNHYLVDIPVPEVGVHLLESGAALIDFQEHCPWLSLPYHPFHLEFGIFLSALGLLSKRTEFEPFVRRLANWQLNTLDATGQPFYALYTREKDNNYFETVLLHYLFFKGAACLTQEKKFFYFAELTGERLKENCKLDHQSINPLWVIMEKVFEFTEMKSEAFDLPTQIHDSSTSLIGYRTEKQSAICTLHGNHTGLGYFRDHDVEIVNYGPQYYPFDDCNGFGIEGNHLSDHGIRQSIMEWNRYGFSQKGCVRMVDQHASSTQMGLFRGIWLEVVQEYKHSQLQVKTNFLGLDGWESVAFCFFVKAKQSCINQYSLLPGKLERYEGNSFPVTFEGEKSTLELTAQTPGSMQVIPLCGGINFWGADFLVAYLLNTQQRNYGWCIKTLN
jgi:hypothetical protein